MKTTFSKEGAATPTEQGRFDKKKVNVRVNPIINFQIGLIAALLLAFLIIELTSEQVEPQKTVIASTDITDPDWNNPTFIEVPNQVIKKVELVKTIKELPPEIVDNNTPDPEPIPDVEPVEPVVMPSKALPTSAKPAIGNPSPVVKKAPVTKAKIITTMDGVDAMPLFPGCESLDNNQQRKSCFNDKMQRFVERKFDKELAKELGLNSGEIVKIDILFTINEKGFPVNVQVKTPHAIFEKEAYRLIGKLPRITPGQVKGEPVSVYFHLPIRFRSQ